MNNIQNLHYSKGNTKGNDQVQLQSKGGKDRKSDTTKRNQDLKRVIVHYELKKSFIGEL